MHLIRILTPFGNLDLWGLCMGWHLSPFYVGHSKIEEVASPTLDITRCHPYNHHLSLRGEHPMLVKYLYFLMLASVSFFQASYRYRRVNEVSSGRVKGETPNPQP